MRILPVDFINSTLLEMCDPEEALPIDEEHGRKKTKKVDHIKQDKSNTNNLLIGTSTFHDLFDGKNVAEGPSIPRILIHPVSVKSKVVTVHIEFLNGCHVALKLREGMQSVNAVTPFLDSLVLKEIQQ
jgi:hypothetical protein